MNDDIKINEILEQKADRVKKMLGVEGVGLPNKGKGLVKLVYSILKEFNNPGGQWNAILAQFKNLDFELI